MGAASDVLAQYAPAFHGFYRALISTSFPWTLAEWAQLSSRLNALFEPEAIERLNRLLVDVLQHESEDPEKLRFIQTLLSRYVSHGRPLTGYFIVCCVTEALWTVLSQAIIPPTLEKTAFRQEIQEAEAANKAWASILHGPVTSRSSPLDATIRNALRSTTEYATGSFTELLIQIEEMDQEPAVDTYAWETMSESLVRFLS